MKIKIKFNKNLIKNLIQMKKIYQLAGLFGYIATAFL